MLVFLVVSQALAVRYGEAGAAMMASLKRLMLWQGRLGGWSQLGPSLRMQSQGLSISRWLLHTVSPHGFSSLARYMMAHDSQQHNLENARAWGSTLKELACHLCHRLLVGSSYRTSPHHIGRCFRQREESRWGMGGAGETC